MPKPPSEPRAGPQAYVRRAASRAWKRSRRPRWQIRYARGSTARAHALRPNPCLVTPRARWLTPSCSSLGALAMQERRHGTLVPKQVIKLSGISRDHGSLIIWRGRLRGGAERALDGMWVRANFRSSFIETVLAARGAFVHIPTGCAQVRPPPPAVADHRDGPEVLAAQSTPVNSTAACPLVAYSQGGVDLCAAYGLASAVHCFGDTVAATAIARSARAALASGDAFGHIRTVVRSEAAGWSEVSLFNHDPLLTPIADPVHLQLVGIRRRGQPCDCDLWRVRLRLGGRARPAPLACDA